MPIDVKSPVKVIDEEAFHEIAYQFMGVVFETHNEFPRLMDERPFLNIIRRKCEARGMAPTRREVEINVTFQTFKKVYFVDLLSVESLLVEAKTVECLNPSHTAQTLNYLMLTGLRHGLLVNLRTPRVQKRFVSTSLDATQRRRIVVDDAFYRPSHKKHERLREGFEALLRDWGGFLALSLYYEAVIHLFRCRMRRVPIFHGNTQAGSHETVMVTDDSAVFLTSLSEGKREMREQLWKLLAHTQINVVQWINLDQHQVRFEVSSFWSRSGFR